MTTCKYCGVTFTYNGNVCAGCYKKMPLLPRFRKARDTLRVKCGLPPLSSDENTCSNVD